MVRKSKATRRVDRWLKDNQFKHLCQCGCGEYIEVKREHRKAAVGIPKFIVGHNLRLEPEPPLPEPEKISVWERLSPEEQERRLGLLKSFGMGEDNPAWKGGRRIDDSGYIQIRVGEHPFAKDGYVWEHRYVVEEHMRQKYPDHPLLAESGGKKYLRPETVVHHIDEVKTNNSLSNLMLLPDQRFHAFIHNSPLPMEERLRRIEMGICHSGALDEIE